MEIHNDTIWIDVIGNSYEVKVELLHKGMQFFEAFPCKETIVSTEEAEVIEFFVQWLYTPGRFFKVPEIKTVLDLWVFAGRIKCKKLQNYSMNFIQKYYRQNNEFMDDHDLYYIVGATQQYGNDDHPLRNFCALQLHYQNNFEDGKDVGLILQDSLKAIQLYLEYELTYCLDAKSDPRNREKSHVDFTSMIMMNITRTAK